MYVVIAGGGKVGFFLARALLEAGHEVLVVEKLERHYQGIVEELGEMAMLGDACEVRTLERTGIARADVVVAVTGDDEDNLVICQIAKHRYKVPRTIARVNNPKNEEIFKLLGIDQTVSATRRLQSIIEEGLPTSSLLPLFPLAQGHLEIVELMLPPGARAVGQTVRALALPPQTVLAVLLRDGRPSHIDGDTALHAGDRVIAVTPPEEAAALRLALLGSAVSSPNHVAGHRAETCSLCGRQTGPEHAEIVPEPTAVRALIANLEERLAQLHAGTITPREFLQWVPAMCALCRQVMSGIDERTDRDNLERRLQEEIEILALAP